MKFGEAVELMRTGSRVARVGWNGKGMFLFLVMGWKAVPFDTGNGFMRATDSATETCERLPFVAMKTADNKVVPWLASQTDMLSEDWTLVV